MESRYFKKTRHRLSAPGFRLGILSGKVSLVVRRVGVPIPVILESSLNRNQHFLAFFPRKAQSLPRILWCKERKGKPHVFRSIITNDHNKPLWKIHHGAENFPKRGSLVSDPGTFPMKPQTHVSCHKCNN